MFLIKNNACKSRSSSKFLRDAFFYRLSPVTWTTAASRLRAASRPTLSTSSPVLQMVACMRGTQTLDTRSAQNQALKNITWPTKNFDWWNIFHVPEGSCSTMASNDYCIKIILLIDRFVSSTAAISDRCAASSSTPPSSWWPQRAHTWTCGCPTPMSLEHVRWQEEFWFNDQKDWTESLAISIPHS